MLIHHYTPLRQSRQSSTPCPIRQSIFQQQHSLHNYTECHLGPTRHTPTLLTQTDSTTPNIQQIYHHLHRCLLHRRRQTDSFTPSNRRTRHTITPSSEMPNGWAAVIFHPDSTTPLVFNGTVPPKLLKHFASNKAFIYFLEAWAAIITPVLVRPLLTPIYIQLCDNDAATHAIIKGSGSHTPLNNLIGSHWTWHNRQHLRQILHRVPTHANIADPFSREDFSIAHQLGWHRLEPPTKKLLSTTQKIIGDSKFAHTIGFSDNQYIQQFQQLAYNKLFPHNNYSHGPSRDPQSRRQ